MIRLRALTPSDLTFADSLRQMAGWNQTPAYWSMVLDLEPNGCFLAEWNGQPAGTVTTTRYGETTAWIGMLLVHPDYRRRGLGTALLERGLEYLRAVPSVKLDATPMGKTVYDQYGFVDEWPLARWERAGPRPGPPVAGVAGQPSPFRIEPYQPRDLADMARLDALAFGANRERLLGHLLGQSRRAAVLRHSESALAGFGLLRSGAKAEYLGPIAAASAEAGRALVETLAAVPEERPLYWDIPEGNGPMVKLAEQLGFQRQRPLMRMVRGANPSPGRVESYFAIADPSIG